MFTLASRNLNRRFAESQLAKKVATNCERFSKKDRPSISKFENKNFQPINNQISGNDIDI